jgi:hypothetical protein
LLAALGLVLCAIALWQPVGPITDSPGKRLVLDLPTSGQFVLLGAALAAFLAFRTGARSDPTARCKSMPWQRACRRSR